MDNKKLNDRLQQVQRELDYAEQQIARLKRELSHWQQFAAQRVGAITMLKELVDESADKTEKPGC